MTHSSEMSQAGPVERRRDGRDERSVLRRVTERLDSLTA